MEEGGVESHGEEGRQHEGAVPEDLAAASRLTAAERLP
jgi:hypothetical protein